MARTAVAQDDTVRVTCDALTPEDAAQVEARTRATLLLSEDTHLSVRIECVADQATVRATAGERTEATSLTLSGENARDALVAAVERTLEALERPGEAGVSAPPQPDATKPARDETAVAPPPPKSESRSEATPPPGPAASGRDARSWGVGAGMLGELWSGNVALGARLRAERRLAPFSAGAALGWLRALSGNEPFRADELHAFAYGGLDERTTGLSGSLGAGISVLTVAPDADIVVQSPTTLSLVLFDLGLARPVRFGRASLVPAFHLRVFPARREVNVDGAHRLVLPPLCPSLFLGFGYEI